jgi:hypothetical protein
MILDKKIEEVHKLSSRVDDLELQLNEAKEDCQRYSFSSTYEHDTYFVYQSVASSVEGKAPKYLSIYVLLFQFRMASKTKKVIKAHGRYMKAQEDLKRQAFHTNI